MAPKRGYRNHFEEEEVEVEQTLFLHQFCPIQQPYFLLSMLSNQLIQMKAAHRLPLFAYSMDLAVP